MNPKRENATPGNIPEKCLDVTITLKHYAEGGHKRNSVLGLQEGLLARDVMLRGLGLSPSASLSR